MSERIHEIGDVISGRFRLAQQIGQGAFGAVWRAEDEETSTEVAIKILFDNHRGDKKKLARFVQEGKIMARLDHPNIARMIASSGGDEGEEAWVAMELIDGEPLHARLIDASKTN